MELVTRAEELPSDRGSSRKKRSLNSWENTLFARSSTYGTKIGRYEILAEVGQGGMATVYKALDTELHREVAIKIMHPHLAKDPNHRSRFRREAQAVARLHHNNIIEIYDFSSQNDEDITEPAYIVMEFVQGENLQEYIERQELPLCELGASFVASLLPALEHAHQHNIIHRDLKPENVLIDEKGDFKLTDFGLARIIDDETMTRTGTILGSPAYMSPELAEGKTGDHRSDIFSLGILLYRLVCQQHPFLSNNPAATLRALLDGNYPPPDAVRSGVGKKLSKIIDKALQVDPDKRYASAQEMNRDLREYLLSSDIHHPEEIARSYILNPEKTLPTLQRQILQSLKRHIQKFIDQKQFAAAFDYCNRILAINPNDPDVPEFLEDISKHSSSKFLTPIAFLTLIFFLAVILGISHWHQLPQLFRTSSHKNPLPKKHQPLHPSPRKPIHPPQKTSLHNASPKIQHPPIQRKKEPIRRKKKPSSRKLIHLALKKPLTPSRTKWKLIRAKNFRLKYFYYIDKKHRRHWLGFKALDTERGTIKFDRLSKHLLNRPVWFRLRRKGLHHLQITVPKLRLAIRGKVKIPNRQPHHRKLKLKELKKKVEKIESIPLYPKRKIRFRIYPWSKLYLYLDGEFQPVTKKHVEHIFPLESGPGKGKITLLEARTKNRNPLRLQLRIPVKGISHYRKVTLDKKGKIVSKGAWIALTRHNGLETLTTKFTTNFKNAKIRVRTNVAGALLFISHKGYNEALGRVSPKMTLLPVLWIWKTYKVPVIIRIIKAGYKSWVRRKILRAGETLDLKLITLKKRKK